MSLTASEEERRLQNLSSIWRLHFFNTPEEIRLSRVTVSEAKKFLEDKHFTEGSMAPKVRAALQFVENGGKECIITEAKQLSNPEAGTRIVQD